MHVPVVRGKRPPVYAAPALATWALALLCLSAAAPAVAAEPAGRAAAAPQRDCDDPACPWMVVLPAGRFTMGTADNEPELDQNELPRRQVKVRAFAIGQFEVTFEQWDACVAAGGCRRITQDEGWGRGPRPVIHTRWDDAQAFVAWLSRRTGRHYRLPSEAEWEYAARAGSTTPFGLGARIGTDQANFAGGFTYNGSTRGVDRQQTLPVGSFAPNAWGLHDLHGNALEWVQDCWHDNYQGAPTDARPWMKGCSEPARHVIRSGSWYDAPRYARSAFRGSIEVGNGFALGFRVARD